MKIIYSGSYAGVKRPQREAGRVSPSTDGVYNEQNFPSTLLYEHCVCALSFEQVLPSRKIVYGSADIYLTATFRGVRRF